MKFVLEIGISAEHPSVFSIFSKLDDDIGDFLCFWSWLLLLLTDDESDSDVSLTVIVRFSLRNKGVNYLVDGVN